MNLPLIHITKEPNPFPPPPPPHTHPTKTKKMLWGGGGGPEYALLILSITDLPQALMNTIMWQYSHTGWVWYCLFNILTQTTFNRLTLLITATKPQHKPVYTLTSFVWWHLDKPRPQDPNCLPLWIVWPSSYLDMQRCCMWWLQCIVLQVVYWLVHSGLHSTSSLQCSMDLPQVWQHKLYILHKLCFSLLRYIPHSATLITPLTHSGWSLALWRPVAPQTITTFTAPKLNTYKIHQEPIIPV